MAQDITAKDRYSQLQTDRSTPLDTAVTCAELSLPYLIRDTGSDASTEYPNNYVRGFVAKLVNNLSGKLAKTIMPTNQPFHRLVPTQEALNAVSNNNQDMMDEALKIVATKDEAVFRYISKSKFRTVLYPLLDHSIVTGNFLIEKLDNKFRLFALDSYVVKRDARGEVIDLVIEEKVKYQALPVDLQAGAKEDEDNELYTRCVLQDGSYLVTQELNGELVNGSEQTLKKITDRFLVGAWNLLHGEDYGRGHVYIYKDTIEDLNKHLMAVSKSAIINSKAVFTVNPNGMTKYKDFVNAATGDAIIGQPTDIGVVKTEKHNDLQSSMQMIEQYKQELSEAFLMGTGAVRDSERTTKYEVQVLMSELEGSLGGIHTSLAEQIQLPNVEWALKDLKIDLGKDIEVDIISGAEALGKNIETMKIQDLMENVGMLAQLVGPEKVAQEINTTSVIAAMVANSGVASKNLMYSKQEKQALMEAQQEKAALEQAMNPALQNAGAMAGQQAMGGQAQ